MRSHLRSLHPSDFAAMENEEKEADSGKCPRAVNTIKSKNTPVENQLPALFEA